MATDNDEKKADVDDISLEEQRPVRKSGAGLGWLILIIVLVVAALLVYGAYVKKQQAEAEAKAKADAAASRVAQVGAANDNVKEAVALAEQGNMVAAIAKLQTAENLYSTVISGANEVGEQAAAADALAKKGIIQDARQALELEQQRFQEAVKTQLDVLRSGFGIPAAAAAPATGTAQSSAEAPAGETTEQPPATTPAPQPTADAEAQPAPAEQPAAPEAQQPAGTTTPATGATPAAGG